MAEDQEYGRGSKSKLFAEDDRPSPSVSQTEHARASRYSEVGEIPANPAQQGNGSAFTIFLLLNAAMGAGVLSYPYSFGVAGGIPVSLAVQFLLLFLVTPPLFIMAYCSDQIHKDTYHEVVRYCGFWWSMLSTLVAICFGYAVDVMFLVIVGDVVEKLFEAMYGPPYCNYWYMTRLLLVPVLAFIFIMPYIFMQRIAFVKYNSVLGTLSVFYFGILVVGEYFAVDAKPSNIKWAPKSAMDVISLLPSLATGFMFHASAVPVYSCMKERNLKTWRSVIFITMAVIYTVTGMAGIFGYMTFGDDVSSDIMQNYDPRRPEIIIGLVAVMTAQIMTFPMHLFVGRSGVMTVYTELKRLRVGDHFELIGKEEKTVRIVFSIVWLLTCLLSAFIPAVIIVIHRIGALCVLLMFFFPGVCLIKLVQNEHPRPFRNRSKLLFATGVGYAVLGAILFIIMTVQTLIKDFTTDYSRPPCPPDTPKSNATFLA